MPPQDHIGDLDITSLEVYEWSRQPLRETQDHVYVEACSCHARVFLQCTAISDIFPRSAMADLPDSCMNFICLCALEEQLVRRISKVRRLFKCKALLVIIVQRAVLLM